MGLGTERTGQNHLLPGVDGGLVISRLLSDAAEFGPRGRIATGRFQEGVEGLPGLHLLAGLGPQDAVLALQSKLVGRVFRQQVVVLLLGPAQVSRRLQAQGEEAAVPRRVLRGTLLDFRQTPLGELHAGVSTDVDGRHAHLFQYGEACGLAQPPAPPNVRTEEGRAGRHHVLRLAQFIGADVLEDAEVVLGLC